MRGFFRAWKRKPAVHVQLTREDLADVTVAHAWGLTWEQWRDDLTDFERKECRRLVTTAPRFEVTA